MRACSVSSPSLPQMWLNSPPSCTSWRLIRRSGPYGTRRPHSCLRELLIIHSVLETNELLLLPWQADHVALLGRLTSDPRVVRHIGRGGVWSPSRVIEISDWQLRHWHEHCFGWRVIVEKDTGQQSGLAALNPIGPGIAGVDADEHEIGWWLMPEAWGRGVASDAARAVAQDAFLTHSIPQLTARIQPANSASIRVARSLGMTHVFDTTGRFDGALSIYRLKAPLRLATPEIPAGS
jgi:RimJ/RimL family protein N-acetyltransferase